MSTIQSFTNRYAMGAMIAAAVVALAGCEGPAKRLNAPPQGHTDYPNEEMQAHYTPMVDNAMLSDMSMSAVHFVPHQAELNANGIRRLQRYSEILKVYGGTLRYDGVRDDASLAQDRIRRIEEYLASAGLNQGQFKVERGMAGGAGINADEAMIIRAGSYAKPDGGDSGGGGMTVKELLGTAGGKGAK